jgi:hypothetical protein
MPLLASEPLSQALTVGVRSNETVPPPGTVDVANDTCTAGSTAPPNELQVTVPSVQGEVTRRTSTSVVPAPAALRRLKEAEAMKAPAGMGLRSNRISVCRLDVPNVPTSRANPPPKFATDFDGSAGSVWIDASARPPVAPRAMFTQVRGWVVVATSSLELVGGVTSSPQPTASTAANAAPPRRKREARVR